LGLWPLPAVTSTVVNALGLGLATLLVLMGSNLGGSLIRNFVKRILFALPAFVMINRPRCNLRPNWLMQANNLTSVSDSGAFFQSPLIVTKPAPS